ncbi:MAG: DUF2071 domain-containing protein, partial [Chitinophagaceae bacterium]
ICALFAEPISQTIHLPQKIFLEAEWRKLVMVNFPVDAELLQPYVPAGTELDLYNGKCFVSLIGFLFLNTRLKGFTVPFHSSFEEVNLRFYVRQKTNNTWRRGTVFIKEIVPKWAISFGANYLYNEPYETLPMKHSIEVGDETQRVAYSWKKKHWNSLSIVASSATFEMEAQSEQEFICEHYWGYNKGRRNRTLLYAVEHPRWKVHKTITCSLDVDFENLYGEKFGFLKTEQPASAFLVEGSKILIREGQVL